MTHATNQQAAERSALAYEEYLVPAQFKPCADLLIQRAAPRTGERVLDVATGTGIVAREVAPLVHPGSSVTGLDANPAMLTVADSIPVPSGAPITWTEGDAESLPFSDASFDLVLCQQGLQFFPNREVALREMHRVLADGGRVGIATWCSMDDIPFVQALSSAIERHLGSSGLTVPFSLGDPEELRALLSGAGFREVTLDQAHVDGRYPDPDRYLQMLVMAVAAVLPEMAEMSEEARSDLVANISGEVEQEMQAHTEGDALVVRLGLNLAIAWR
jgi:ubiquinone/menaquinone biosynthesis C-methylase UbiE